MDSTRPKFEFTQENFDKLVNLYWAAEEVAKVGYRLDLLVVDPKNLKSLYDKLFWFRNESFKNQLVIKNDN